MARFLLLAVVVLLTSTLYGENSNLPTSSKDQDTQVKDSLMLEKREYRDNEKLYELRDLSEQLGAFQKYQFYERYKATGWWCLLNPLLGLGSWIQGDYQNGAIITLSMLSGGVLMVLGSKTNGTSTLPNGRTTSNVEVINPGIYYPGVILAMGGEIYGIAAPWFFESSDNSKLQKALVLDDLSRK